MEENAGGEGANGTLHKPSIISDYVDYQRGEVRKLSSPLGTGTYGHGLVRMGVITRGISEFSKSNLERPNLMAYIFLFIYL